MSHFSDDEPENRPLDPSNTAYEHSSEGPPDEAMEPNRLAALIEGRLSELDREDLIASMGPADAAGVLSDAMTALAEVEGADGARTATRARGRRWHPGLWLALAACLAGVLLIPAAWLRMDRGSSAGPEQYAALLTAHGVHMPADWNDTPWDVTRGSDEVSLQGRSFQIGARLTDLRIAAQQRDETKVVRYAAELTALMDAISGAGPSAAAFRKIASHGSWPVTVADVDSAAYGVPMIPGLTLVNSGAWIEAMRLSAAAHNASALQAERAASPSGVPTSVDSLVTDLAAHMAARGSADWPTVMAELDQIAIQLGR